MIEFSPLGDQPTEGSTVFEPSEIAPDPIEIDGPRVEPSEHHANGRFPRQVDDLASDPFLAFAIECGYDLRRKFKRNERHIVLGLAVLARMRSLGEQLIETPSGPWLHSQGVWERCDMHWLAMQIELACILRAFNSDTKLINETRNWILRQPELWRDSAPQSGAQ